MGQWIVGVISFQKIFGLCGIKGHIVEIRWDVTLEDGRTHTRNVKIELEFWNRIRNLSPDMLQVCGDYTNCINSVGSFSCECQDGFHSWEANRGCLDIDESDSPLPLLRLF